MKLLKDKVIFLTGGTDGIGYECAKAYANEGAHLIIVAPENDRFRAAKSSLGAEHLFVSADVSVAFEVKKAFVDGMHRFSRIDAIHNNAGIAHPSKMLNETTEEEWEQLMNVNLKSILHTTRFGLEHLKHSRGCILNTSSLVGEIGQELHAAYTATKGGINALTKSMALDYAKYGIRVNAVSPAGVLTPMLEKWKNEQPDPVVMHEYLDAIHALGYCPTGDVIADACVFLLSDKARFITGCIMPVTGGAELGYRSVLQTNVSEEIKTHISNGI